MKLQRLASPLVVLVTVAAAHVACGSDSQTQTISRADAGSDAGAASGAGTLTDTACSSNDECKALDDAVCVFEVGASCEDRRGRCLLAGPPSACETPSAVPAPAELSTPDLDCDGNVVAGQTDPCSTGPTPYASVPLRCRGTEAGCDVPRPGEPCSMDRPCGDPRLVCAYAEIVDSCAGAAGRCILRDIVEECGSDPRGVCGCDGNPLPNGACLRGGAAYSWMKQPLSPSACSADAGADAK